MKYDFQTYDENKTTFAKRMHKSAQSPYKVHYCEICLGEIHTNINVTVMSYMSLVNGWGKI